MSELSVGAIAVAFEEYPDYRPVAALEDGDELRLLAGGVAVAGRVPLERLEVLAPCGDAKDVGSLALATLGVPTEPQPLFLVRSGPLRDPYVAALAQLVHESGWPGEDFGITHLDELGGTAVFDLLEWAVDDGAAATALVCDEPVFADSLHGTQPVAAVALRVRRGPGPLRVHGSGEGAPHAGVRDARHRYTGSRPCDGWLALHAAAAAGRIADGDRILLHTQGPHRQGWLLLEATRTADLRLLDSGVGMGSWADL
jgi:hypothetical protein